MTACTGAGVPAGVAPAGVVPAGVAWPDGVADWLAGSVPTAEPEPVTLETVALTPAAEATDLTPCAVSPTAGAAADPDELPAVPDTTGSCAAEAGRAKIKPRMNSAATTPQAYMHARRVSRRTLERVVRSLSTAVERR